MKLSRAEMETVIRRAADESTWTVISEDPAICRRLEKCFGPGAPYYGETALQWEVPRNAVKFKAPMSPERRAALSAQGKKYGFRKKS